MMNLVDRLLEEDLAFEEFDLAITAARRLFREDRSQARELSGRIRERLVDHLENYPDEDSQALTAGWALAARYAEAESVHALLEGESGLASDRMDLAKKHYHHRLKMQTSRRQAESRTAPKRRDQFFYWLAIAELDRGEAGIKSGVVRSAPHDEIRGHLRADAASLGTLIRYPVTFEPRTSIDFDSAHYHLSRARKHLERSRLNKSRGQLQVVDAAEHAFEHYSGLSDSCSFSPR